MKLPKSRVIKLGGSLLEWVDLPSRFHKWLHGQPPALNLLIVGGGQVVNNLRELDRVHALDATFVHWLAVDLMTINARTAAKILDLKLLEGDQSELHAIMSDDRMDNFALDLENAVAIVAPTAFYSQELVKHSHCPLPISWDCTSDSIAAYLATQVGADELVLLKSSLPKGESERVVDEALATQFAEVGLVDRVFPIIARELARVRIVNLRA